MPNTFWWLLNFESYVHVYLSFRCIFLICSCHLSNHPSILWTILYPSPDDGYYNRNVNVDFTSWYIHLFGLYFFLLPSYCRILSIFTFIYKYIRNIIKHNERMNTLLYKNIISHTLFLKGWCWLCVRDELETGTHPSSSDHSSTSFSS